jgi:two-component system, OmpR family, alkaline phosphatase synthesis response regulator PhoP
MTEEANCLARILFIEDDLNLQKSLTFILQREGFSVASAANGRDGLQLARAVPPDLVLLDLRLPDMDGFAVCRELKAHSATARAFIVMLTGKALVEDVVAGLDRFADDYITKPFEPAILLARLRAVLRRRSNQPASAAARHFPPLSIDPECRQVDVAGTPAALTRSEFDILALLTSRPNRVFSRAQIIDHIRNDDYLVNERVVDFLIAGLRKKIGVCAGWVETVRGVGYRFHDPD